MNNKTEPIKIKKSNLTMCTLLTNCFDRFLFLILVIHLVLHLITSFFDLLIGLSRIEGLDFATVEEFMV